MTPGRLVRRRSRALFLEAARRWTDALGIRHQAGIFIVPSGDLTVRRKLFLNGSRSEFVVLDRAVDVLSRIHHPFVRRTLIDVGANIGTTTVAALALHGFGRVVACEPDPEAVRFLRATVAVNDLDKRVTILEAAISDVPGLARFAARPAGPKGRATGAGRLRVGDAGTGDVNVRVASLDSLVEEGIVDVGDVALLWVDAQGHEGSVLAGATSLTRRSVPVVLAVRGRRLRKLGVGGDLARIVSARFESLVDLRTPDLGQAWEPAFHPPAEIARIIEGERSTDVLLL